MWWRLRGFGALCTVLFAAALQVAHAQTDIPGWLDVTTYTMNADATAPLSGTQLVLLAADGSTVDVEWSDDAGRVRLADAPGTYTLVVSHAGYTATGSLTCGDAGWSAGPLTGDGALHDAALTLNGGSLLCRSYLFAPIPPPAPTPPPATEASPAPSPETPPAQPQHPVYLTFDDGYLNLCATVEMVHTLGLRATFFLTGQAILEFPDCVRRLVAYGDTLGNHTFAHENLTRLSADGIAGTLQRTENAALAVAGVSTKPLCRPPYGAINAAVRSVAASWGCRMVLWDRDTRDWSGIPAASIENSALSVGCGGEVILLHTQAFPRDQVAVPYIVDTLRRRGCDFAVL